jgi:hypothetical protein
MAVGAESADDRRRGGLILGQVNKVHHVRTIARVAEMLCEDEDWLWDVAVEMDQEDGLIWVYGPGDESVMAFTDFGIETLTGLVEIFKADPDLLKRSTDQKVTTPRPTPNALMSDVNWLGRALHIALEKERGDQT